MFDRNEEKNKLLIQQRGVSFEDVVDAIEDGYLTDDIIHHNLSDYPGKRVLIVKINNYIYKIPYVLDGNTYFLKTIYPDRKATKKYLNQ